MIGHLIIVAGVSGAGKSTFVRNLVKNPGALGLPDVSDWLIVTNRNRWDGEPCEGALLDFDMENLADPALNMTRHAERITIVNLRPPLDAIVRQLSEREYAIHASETETRAKLKWHIARGFLKVLAIVSSDLEKRVRRRTPFRVKHRVARLNRKLDLYSDDWLRTLYARWDEMSALMENATCLTIKSSDISASNIST